MLAENRLEVQRHAAKGYLAHRPAVTKTKRAKPPKTETQAIVMQRIIAELETQKLNPTSLARRANKVGLQRTLADILAGADPRLKTLDTVAKALGVAAWRLLIPLEGGEARKIIDFPQPPPILGQSGKEYRLSKGRRRKVKG